MRRSKVNAATSQAEIIWLINESINKSINQGMKGRALTTDARTGWTEVEECLIESGPKE